MALIELADPTMLPATPVESSASRDLHEHVLAAGTKVDVRRRLDGKWARGFEVVAGNAKGYCLRRLSDGSVLPVLFPIGDVRKAKKQNTWWY